MKVSPTHLQSMGSSIDIDNTTTHTKMAYHRLLTAATLTIMDPDEPKPLMKLSFYIGQD